MSVVFINYPLETFTPTQSGAIATIIHELCVAAQREGTRPLVISQGSTALPFGDVDVRFIDYPKLPQGPVGVFCGRVQRKLGGWRHLRQEEYARRVARELVEAGTERPWVLFNDPETAVFLRERFPRATIVHWFQNQHECKPRFAERFAGTATRVLACSAFTAKWVEKFYGIAAGGVEVVHNGVDTVNFAPTNVMPEGPPVINFVGRTGIEKGPDILLRAALRLARVGQKFGLQLLGSNHWDRLEMDDYQRQLCGLAEELEKLGIAVRRPGHIDRRSLPGELRKAHIHVVPARWDEPFGMTTIEGMACGLATVASRTGGTPEVVGDAALLFERENETELAGHLERLLVDEALRRDYAARGRERAVRFDWSATWNRLSTLLNVHGAQQACFV